MNKLRATLLAMSVLLSFGSVEPVKAQTSNSNPFSRFELELKKYDPAAIQAAEEQLDLIDNEETRKAGQESLKGLQQSVINALKAEGKAVSDEVADEFMAEFFKIMNVEYADAQKNVSLLAFLESFTTEELVAMNTFYKSGIGAVIAKKLPAYAIRMGQMRSQFSAQLIPLAFSTARERLKQRGKLL